MDWIIPLTRLMQDDNDPELPPATPPTYKFEGPWFQTQLVLSFSIGFASFLIFSFSRPRWPIAFAPRTKLQGFSPHEAHSQQSFFSWILPTIRTSEFTILQIVGLDAAVLLNFLKMSFQLFTTCAILATLIVMPLNWRSNGGLDGGSDDTDWPSLNPDDPPGDPSPEARRSWLDLLNDASADTLVYFVFSYLFTGLALYFIHRNFQRFIRARQLFSLELVHSIAARTVMLTKLPHHLRGERTLANYFEGMNLTVESVSICREVSAVRKLLEERTRVLLQLESMWSKYVGNPSTVKPFDPSQNVRSDNAPNVLVDVLEPDVEAQPNRLVIPHGSRPTMRPKWFSKKVDALDYLENRFTELDEQVKNRRKFGKFKATDTAFVTFQTMSSAQVASQVVHAPHNGQSITVTAPEPRDVIWANMSYSQAARNVRELIVFGAMIVLLFFWVIPVTTLATLLSYKEIQKSAPWLGRLIDQSPRFRAIVQNSLPSVAVISFNALLPMILEGLSYVQGYKARSYIEYSLLKKYFLFLIINVVFIFLFTSTYFALFRDLADSPAKIPEKLANALTQGTARHFFLSYVILQGLGVMPLQLLNLGVLIPQLVFRAFISRTPRDYAELNAPPMINYGAVYPQAILIFIITLIYSVYQPMILIFGSIYFGISYVVYKYKLLFVFYKPYESRGQAWPITYVRLVLGVLLFQLFMTGIFTLQKSFVFSSLMAPLILYTLYWSWATFKEFEPLSSYVSLSSICEVQRGEPTQDLPKLLEGDRVTRSQSNLHRRRYAENDETLYVAPADDRTDYSQPPMSNWYYGVLNTGKRRYGHPALTGVLPSPWLPIKKGQSLANHVDGSVGLSQTGDPSNDAVVLTLRRKYSVVRGDARRSWAGVQDAEAPTDAIATTEPSSGEESSNPWRDARPGPSQPVPSTSHPAGPPQRRLDFDDATGVIMLPEDGGWLEDADESDEEENWTEDAARSHSPGGVSGPNGGESDEAEAGGDSGGPMLRRHGTYFHRPPSRSVTRIPGAFPR
ncbi:DUF221-domain-containing protein [Calocera cornea HHB12733]|uniref:DUF221-domain-containing protein n=1 Tax=Calocera cornea HHB12733 TaxID=1353952 RepID=A0A165E7C8_9BASI|nr:DUF221-domain-containing protein [Calocera cornea HHB12733]